MCGGITFRFGNVPDEELALFFTPEDLAASHLYDWGNREKDVDLPKTGWTLSRLSYTISFKFMVRYKNKGLHCVAVFLSALMASAFFFGLSSSASAGPPAKTVRQCDIWGIDFASEPVDVEKVSDASGETTIRITNQQRFNEVWKKIFGVTQIKGMNIYITQRDIHYSKLYPKEEKRRPFCVNGRVYELSSVLNSETEGTFFVLSAAPSKTTCNETRAVPFPADVLSALSVSCPFLRLGVTQTDIETKMGPPDVRFGSSWYYFDPRYKEQVNSRSCLKWLKEDESLCCYPGIHFNFRDQRLQLIDISNGYGEGPPCEE